MAGKLEGKVALITGAARGQGRSHVLHLAREGADIIAIDACQDFATCPYPLATQADLDETTKDVENLGRRIVAVKADVQDYAAVKAAVDQGVKELGRLDIVCINQGIMSYSTVEDMPLEMWHEMINVNLNGVFHTAKAAIPHIKAGKAGGSIVITSSGAALRDQAHIAHYGAAKKGVIAITKTLAIELGSDWIRVNSLHPTNVNTGMIQNEAVFGLVTGGREDATPEDAIAVFQSMNRLPLPWVEPEDISKAVVFLVSDDGRYITGAQIPIDAGMQL